MNHEPRARPKSRALRQTRPDLCGKARVKPGDAGQVQETGKAASWMAWMNRAMTGF